MKRLSRSRVINDLERIVKTPVAGLHRHQWEARGAECFLDRHSYHSELYSFDIEVLRVRLTGSRRPKWSLYVVSEIWRGDPDEEARFVKWLKVTTGKSTDVMKWIVENRDEALKAV
jgi:hypothetical protein